MGHTEEVSDEFYGQVTDEHFENVVKPPRAAKNVGMSAGIQTAQVGSSSSGEGNGKRPEEPGVNQPELCSTGLEIPPRGVEPLSSG